MPTLVELEAFLDEALPAERMAEIEQRLRDDVTLKQQLAEIVGRRDAGLHSLGAIWRRQRLSCPSREQLGSFLLGAMSRDEAAYVTFHVEVVACRWCAANLDDLKHQVATPGDDTQEHRRRKYFQSSIGGMSPNV